MFPETRDLRGTFLRLPQRVKTRYRENGLIGGGELENSKRGGGSDVDTTIWVLPGLPIQKRH